MKSFEDYMGERKQSKPKGEEDKIFRSDEEIKKARETLNEEQGAVFDSLIEFVRDPDREFAVLIGYAGTGKTYTLSKFIQATKCKVAMSAPTNKAVKVLMENRSDMDSRVQYTTIHKLLALTLKTIFPKKGQNFKPYQKLVSAFRGEVSINNYKIIIIDEVSMLDDELFMMIKKHKKQELKIIFMGDPAQIPPVNKDDAIPLLATGRDLHNIEAYELERIMRQTGDNKILDTAYQIRNNRYQPGDPILNRITNNDVVFCSSNDPDDKEFFGQEMLKYFDSKEFAEDPNYCKTIAWTNKTVNAFNGFIRRKIFKTKTPDTFMPGEKLIADQPIIDGFDIIFQTSDEFEVVETQRKSDTWIDPGKSGAEDFLEQMEMTDIMEEATLKKKNGIVLHYWDTLVKAKDLVDGSEYEKRIKILDPDSEKQLGWILSKLIKMRMFEDFEAWRDKYAKVKYNYAITAHKSQGSTYGTVFLIEDDINKNQKLLERNRIKYTACTRPKDKLYILSKHNRSIKSQGK